MSSDLVFQGDFSFVNVDATSLSTLPHRKQVTRHVHGYRRWKKGQEARRLRESSRFYESAGRSSRPQQLAPGPSPRNNHGPQPAEAALPLRTIRTLPHLIDVVLLSGNSDPFDVLPEQLTATVNSLLSFERDCIFPSVRELELRMTSKENALREVAFTNTWINESQSYLYDGIAIHSYLARIATNRYMFTSQPEFLDAAHEFRRKGVAALKQYMTSSHLDVLRFYRGLLILLWADSSLGDRDAFDHHITVLKDIFQSHHERGSADSSFSLHHFASVLYFEVQYAVMGLSKTALDVDHDAWVEKQFAPAWNQIAPNFPFSRLDADQNLDPQLFGSVRNLYLEVQEIVDIIMRMRMHSLSNTSLTWFYAISKALFAIGRLINIYVEINVEAVLHHADAIGMTLPTVQKLETAALCLCGVYWLRELAGIEHVPISENIKLFIWNPIMLSKLSRLVAAYNSMHIPTVHQLDRAAPLRLWLWISWTGAMAEQSMEPSDGTADEDRQWFTRQFCDFCRIANIRTESLCQGVLNRFLRLHGMKPSSGGGRYARCFPLP